LRIYDITGELIKTLINEHKTPSYYSVRWNGQNEKGEIVPSGLYLYQIISGEYSSTKRMVIVK
jgi:flagellar hook assembly protein FlgD